LYGSTAGRFVWVSQVLPHTMKKFPWESMNRELSWRPNKSVAMSDSCNWSGNFTANFLSFASQDHQK